MPNRAVAIAAVLALFLGLATAFSRIEPWWTSLVTREQIVDSLQERQGRIQRAYAANQAINAVLEQALATAPSAARIRVGLIRRAAPGVPLRLDFTHVVAGTSPGKADPFGNMPLAQWQVYLSDFLQDRCATVSVDDPKLSPDGRMRLDILQLRAVAGCPLFGPNGDLRGGVFLQWADNQPHDLTPMVETLRSAAAKISAQVPEL